MRVSLERPSVRAAMPSRTQNEALSKTEGDVDRMGVFKLPQAPTLPTFHAVRHCVASTKHPNNHRAGLQRQGLTPAAAARYSELEKGQKPIVKLLRKSS